MSTASKAAPPFSARAAATRRPDGGPGALLEALCDLEPARWAAMACLAALEPDDERRLAEALAGVSAWERWSLHEDVATVMGWFDPAGETGAARAAVHAATERAACALLVRARLEPARVRRLLGGFASMMRRDGVRGNRLPDRW